ncbi:FmdB family zinc ribbon protein [Lysinibacter sp. HNR]|uniref:FmdB family zinc ribbon protein n=1 Tax=Lysinibacter sp. HNR TaxID=3031408 RepID=UPI00243540FB|nr:FmdB family zinc ribbon protein [Lysinibacter sp. HNR]WGD38136.1 zinc ribbon domain-containing protein [Lysinibacter sp. HNR]
MPTYSYRCTECGHSFDIYQEFSDASLTVCPQCGGKLRKVFNSIGVTFNGSGFYRTDSRTGGSTPSQPKTGEGKKQASESTPSGSSGGSGSSSNSSGTAQSTSGSSSPSA